ncbi:hypothetical protein EYF80_004391 [Liparis tanakae]|uniref:Uncharacterized protein n=1 Tax=Liparis tanakae TaxID=230148 RepID=A0A4Z2J590_9TELE|nr:hypothetical protein EYF80_004391 [Liparis tanakae]
MNTPASVHGGVPRSPAQHPPRQPRPPTGAVPSSVWFGDGRWTQSRYWKPQPRTYDFSYIKRDALPITWRNRSCWPLFKYSYRKS